MFPFHATLKNHMEERDLVIHLFCSAAPSTVTQVFTCPVSTSLLSIVRAYDT